MINMQGTTKNKYRRSGIIQMANQTGDWLMTVSGEHGATYIDWSTRWKEVMFGSHSGICLHSGPVLVPSNVGGWLVQLQLSRYQQNESAASRNSPTVCIKINLWDLQYNRKLLDKYQRFALLVQVTIGTSNSEITFTGTKLTNWSKQKLYLRLDEEHTKNTNFPNIYFRFLPDPATTTLPQSGASSTRNHSMGDISLASETYRTLNMMDVPKTPGTSVSSDMDSSGNYVQMNPGNASLDNDDNYSVYSLLYQQEMSPVPPELPPRIYNTLDRPPKATW